MKRKIAVGLLVCFLTILSASRAQCLLLEFLPSSQSVETGAEAFVDIVLSGLEVTTQQVGAFSLSVLFDPLFLSAPAVTFGASLGDEDSVLTDIIFSEGLIDFLELSLLDAEELASLQSSTFTLATLSFTTLGEGRSSLMFDAITLSDAAGLSLETEGQGGSITIAAAPAPVPEPSTMLLLGSGLAGLAAFRRRFGGQPVTRC